MNNISLVSIGVTAYNNLSPVGENLVNIKKALDCLVKQDWPNIEIIIQDDCSQDNTATFLREYAVSYPFIKVYQNNINLGVNENIKALIQKIKGEYFLWACLDDFYERDYISSCIKQMQKFPETVACQSYIKVQYPQEIVIFKYKDIYLPSSNKQEILKPSKNVSFNLVIHGLIKSKAAKTIYNYPHLLYVEISIPIILIWMGGICTIQRVLLEKQASLPFKDRYPKSTYTQKTQSKFFMGIYCFEVLYVFFSLQCKGILKTNILSIINMWFGLFVRYYCRAILIIPTYKFVQVKFPNIAKYLDKLISFKRLF